MRIVNQRLVVNSMEPRGAICEYDPSDDRSTLWLSSQGVHMIRPVVADMILKIGSAKLRVRTGDVGGGFGMKIFVHPEYPMVVWASRALKRTVKWIPDRQEAFQSDVQGRDHVSVAEMALDKDARFLGCRITTYAALGAYLSHFSVFIPTMAGTSMLAGLYQTPAIYVNVKGVMTNTVPTDAYRGAGRPEAAYLLERFVDHIARETGLTPDEIRARNLIRPSQIPFKTAMGDSYDSGDFETVMRKGMEKADWKGFPARRADCRQGQVARHRHGDLCREMLRRRPGDREGAVQSGRTLTLYTGNQTNGQGHETALRQIAVGAARHRRRADPPRAGRLGRDARRLHRRLAAPSPSTAPRPWAWPTRSSPRASRWRRACSRPAPPTSPTPTARFRIVGTDRTLSLFEVAKAAKDPKHAPKDGTAEAGLDDEFTRTPEADTFPNGCHICELEIDPDTGTLEILNYSVMDDFGRALNPLLLQGQIHGGVGQGVGQALAEHTVYDKESGQLLSGSFMDYAFPRADIVPPVKFDMHNSPCTTNPLGVKGAGEAGAIGAPPAVINAIVDAIYAHTGMKHVDMPVTPASLWKVIEVSRGVENRGATCGGAPLRATPAGGGSQRPRPGRYFSIASRLHAQTMARLDFAGDRRRHLLVCARVRAATHSGSARMGFGRPRRARRNSTMPAELADVTPVSVR